MKSIIKFAVSNPVTICMLVLAILLLGKISYKQLAVCQEHGVDVDSA